MLSDLVRRTMRPFSGRYQSTRRQKLGKEHIEHFLTRGGIVDSSVKFAAVIRARGEAPSSKRISKVSEVTALPPKLKTCSGNKNNASRRESR